MKNDVSRRGFMKTASAGAASVGVATGFSPFAYAANEKVRVASIGTGGQGKFHLRYGLTPAKNIEMVAVCDVFLANLDSGWEEAGASDNVQKYMDYREMLDKEDIDAVVISTPLHTHHKIAMDCLDAGKYIFLEKTMCYDVEECRDIVKKCHEKGLFAQVGHQRRYNKQYNKAVWLAREKGLCGRINHVTAQWHRNNSWRRYVPPNYELTAQEKQWIKDLEKHVNWRLYEESSGGLVTELATHQIDIANWFLGAVPRRVNAFGGLDYWIDGREVYDNIVMSYEYEIGPDNPGFQFIEPRIDKQKMMRVNRPYAVRMTYSSICANAKRGASELIQGDRASIELTERSGCQLFGEPAIAAEEAAKKKAKEEGEVEGGLDTLLLPNDAYKKGVPIEIYENETPVDQLQMEAFANDIMTGGTPKANEMVGLYTAIAGLAGLEAVREGKEVEIDPALAEFDFETPDPYRYDFYDGPSGFGEDEAAPAEEA